MADVLVFLAQLATVLFLGVWIRGLSLRVRALESEASKTASRETLASLLEGGRQRKRLEQESLADAIASRLAQPSGVGVQQMAPPSAR